MQYKNLLVYTHQGLGDVIVCYGIINALLEKVETIHIPSKNIYLDSVSFLYKDDTRVKIFPITPSGDLGLEHLEVITYAKNNDIPIFKIGFENLREPFHMRQFYEQANVAYKDCWGRFKDPESTEQSQKLFNDLNLLDKDYALVVDYTHSGKFDLKIETDLSKIVMYKTDYGAGIFDWVDVIKNASEIHTTASGPFHLIDHIKSFNKNCKLVYHDVRKGDIYKVETYWEWDIVFYE
jgi:hypothetical protein